MASVRNAGKLPSISELFSPSSFNGQSLVCDPPIASLCAPTSNLNPGHPSSLPPGFLPPGFLPPPNKLFPLEPGCQIQRGPIRVADNQWQATHSGHALGDFVASPTHNQGQLGDQLTSKPLLNDKQISNANFAATHVTHLQQSYHHGKRDHGRVKKRRRHAATRVPCVECSREDSPEWRRGPKGPATLCNACGLRYAKQKRMNEQAPNSTTVDVELEVPTADAQKGSVSTIWPLA